MHECCGVVLMILTGGEVQAAGAADAGAVREGPRRRRGRLQVRGGPLIIPKQEHHDDNSHTLLIE